MSISPLTKRFFTSLAQFLLAVGIVLSIRWALFEPYVIPSGSMIPTLLIHDHILVDKKAYGLRWPFSRKWVWQTMPSRGDVVVFRSVDKEDYFMIKRVVGLPGDIIEIDTNGALLINNQPTKQTLVEVAEKEFSQFTDADLQGPHESWNFFRVKDGGHAIRHTKTLVDRSFSAVEVPKGSLFVMGDNRDFSADSRFWGFLPLENLIGQARWVWLSCHETLSETPLCNPSQLRWQRFFHTIK